jgi:uncharacterized membrane protein
MAQNTAMTGSLAMLFLAAVLFVASHLALANPPLRDGIVARIGERGFLALYSVVAIALFVWLLFAFGAAPYVELWWPSVGLRHIPLVVMPFAFILVVCGNVTPNPTAVRQERLLDDAEPARGIIKITRHPTMWGIALWAASHIAANGDLAAVILMGAMLIVALAGMVLIDRKKRAKAPEQWARFAAVTSVVPFAALIGGRTKLRVAEIGWGKIGFGLVLYALFLAAHRWLFGVSPFPA